MLGSINPVPIAEAALLFVFAAASFVGLIAGAVYLVRSKRVAVNNDLADSAVQSLQASLAAVESRLTVAEAESNHCHDLRAQDQRQIAELKGRVDELRSWVTARDLVAELLTLTRAGFIATGVEPSQLPQPAERKTPSWQ